MYIRNEMAPVAVEGRSGLRHAALLRRALFLLCVSNGWFIVPTFLKGPNTLRSTEDEKRAIQPILLNNIVVGYSQIFWFLLSNAL